MSQLSTAVEEAIDALCASPGLRIRVTQKLAKALLITYPTISLRGRTYTIHTKSIGAGVYEVFAKYHYSTL